jgi:hypothetical protein
VCLLNFRRHLRKHPVTHRHGQTAWPGGATHVRAKKDDDIPGANHDGGIRREHPCTGFRPQRFELDAPTVPDDFAERPSDSYQEHYTVNLQSSKLPRVKLRPDPGGRFRFCTAPDSRACPIQYSSLLVWDIPLFDHASGEWSNKHVTTHSMNFSVGRVFSIVARSSPLRSCYPFWGSVPMRPAGFCGRPLGIGVIPKRELCVNSELRRGRLELSSTFASIVKVFTVSAAPNWFMPWQTKQQRETTGSGFIIEGRR